MEKYCEGQIVYHKATSLRCVVIRINDNKTIKVRTQKDEEKDYYPQELETDEEINARNHNFIEDVTEEVGFGV